MKNTKIIALALSLFTVLSMLASCGFINNGGTRDADSYTANVQIKFATNDDKMKSAIDSMNAFGVVLYDKGNINVSTTSASGDNQVENEYTYIGGILYHDYSVKVGDYSVSESKKALMDDLAREELVAKIGAGAGIGAEDFQNKTEEKLGKVTVYTCTDITDEAKATLDSVMSKRFASIGATVYLESADYIEEQIGGLVDNSVLTCSYVISLNGKSYEVTMRLYTTYDYDTPVEIVRPDNSESYQVVSGDEIIG